MFNLFVVVEFFYNIYESIKNIRKKAKLSVILFVIITIIGIVTTYFISEKEDDKTSIDVKVAELKVAYERDLNTSKIEQEVVISNMVVEQNITSNYNDKIIEFNRLINEVSMILKHINDYNNTHITNNTVNEYKTTVIEKKIIVKEKNDPKDVPFETPHERVYTEKDDPELDNDRGYVVLIHKNGLREEFVSHLIKSDNILKETYNEYF
jgi:hypothetical protein